MIRGGKWWRCSEYEILGDTIVPARRAKVEIYEPLAELEKAKRRRVPLPHVELANADLRTDAGVLRWCFRWGLLGIFLHRTSLAYFWPRWSEAEDGLRPEQVRLDNLRNRTLEYVVLPGASAPPSPDRHPRAPLDDSDAEDAFRREFNGLPIFHRPHAMITDPDQEKISNTSILAGVAPFFPRRSQAAQRKALGPPPSAFRGQVFPPTLPAEREILERARYPLPPSPVFPTSYGEPLAEFRRYAVYVRSHLNLIYRLQRADSREEGERLIRSKHYRTFKACLRGVSPEPVTDENSWSVGWAATSLYAAMHQMMLEDLTAKIVKRCKYKACSDFFLADRASRLYCPPPKKCKKRAEDQRRTERLKSKRQPLGLRTRLPRKPR